VRSRGGWRCNIKMDIRELICEHVNGIKVSQDRSFVLETHFTPC
jgi:hypothetical protein